MDGSPSQRQAKPVDEMDVSEKKLATIRLQQVLERVRVLEQNPRVRELLAQAQVRGRHQ